MPPKCINRIPAEAIGAIFASPMRDGFREGEMAFSAVLLYTWNKSQDIDATLSRLRRRI
jgi:hypothetical protein